MNGKADILKLMTAVFSVMIGYIFQFQHNIFSRRTFYMIVFIKLPSDHIGRQLFWIGICGHKICHLSSIPKNCDLVTDRHDLTHTMGNDNDSVALFFQITENVEKLCGLLRSEHASRLIQDQKFYISV